MRSAVVVMMAGLLCGYAAQQGNGARVVAPATEARSVELLGRVKALEGEWVGTHPETGEVFTACVFKVTSGGTAVREVMFPGSAHEMTNMYHMDGDTLVVTHYCAVGNQPRMRATGMTGESMVFNFDSVTNKTSAGQTCMGDMTIEFKGADHIVERWRATGAGEHPETVIELTRKK